MRSSVDLFKEINDISSKLCTCDSPRTWRTENKKISETSLVENGVPQGTILRPI